MEPLRTFTRDAEGPNGGPHVLSRLRISNPATGRGDSDPGDEPAILALFATVLATSPSYLPGVAAGTVPLDQWYRRKAPQWRRIAHTPAAGAAPIGHVAVRLNGMRPDGPLLRDRLAWELSMLVVAPGVRGCGIATRLVEEATTAFSTPLWASVHEHGPGHRLLTSAGWSVIDEFFWPDDPHPGLILTAPKPAARRRSER